VAAGACQSPYFSSPKDFYIMKNMLSPLSRVLLCAALLIAVPNISFAQNKPKPKPVARETTVVKKSKPTPKTKKTTAKSAKTAKKTSPKAKSKPPKLIQTAVKTNPVSWCLATADVAVEKVLTRQVSIQLGGTYTHQSGEIFDGLTAKINGYAVTPEMRYYWMPFSKIVAPVAKKGKVAPPAVAAPLSFYTAVWGRMSEYSAHVVFPDHPGQKAEIFRRKAYGGGLSFGSQFWLKFRKRPVLICDLSLGGGWSESKTELKLAERGKRIKLERKGFSPVFGFRVGLPIQ
jgi:hypothetical protein